MKFKKKPIIIDAYQWSGAAFDGVVEPWVPILSLDKCTHCGYNLNVHGRISTLEGPYLVCIGDWIITGIKGERYPCKPDIFKITYDLYEVV